MISPCIPDSPEHKTHASLEERLAPFIENSVAPSALVGAFFHVLRRYLAGRGPDTDLEADAFGILAQYESSFEGLRGLYECTLGTFDDLPVDVKRVIVDPVYWEHSSVDEPVVTDHLADRVFHEMLRHAERLYALDPTAPTPCTTEEVPGLPRRWLRDGEEGYWPIICRVNGRRTSRGLTSLAEIKRDEMLEVCTADLEGRPVCTIKHFNDDADPCPGDQFPPTAAAEGQTCLAIPGLVPGTQVVVEGANFFSVETRVRLYNRATGVLVYELDAWVCGDQKTPMTDAVGVVADCRVRDLLTFTLPDGMAEGPYAIRVVVPTIGMAEINSSSMPAEFESDNEYVINVINTSDNFQIRCTELVCENESNPEWLGSDEVGVSVQVYPLNINPAMPAPAPTKTDFEEDNLDGGNRRALTQTLFSGTGFGAIIIVIRGYEIDNRDVYKQQIRNWQDAYDEVIKGFWGKIIGAISTAAGAAIAYSVLTNPPALVVAGVAALIGAVITAVVCIPIAIWAPADLLIQDAFYLTIEQFAILTSPAYPAPFFPTMGSLSTGGVRVRVFPEAQSFTYSERRQYSVSDARYSLALKYDRLP